MTKRKPPAPWTIEKDLRCPICGTVHHTVVPLREGPATIVCCNCHKPFVVQVVVKDEEKDPPTRD